MYIRIGIILYLFIQLVCAKTISKSDVFNNLSKNNLTNNSKRSGLRAIWDNSINDSSYPEYDSEDETYPEEGNGPEDENDSENENDWGCELSDMPPKPGSKCCGIDVSSSPRITDGEPTLLNQYPWMALIEYENPIGVLDVRVSCGGSLISGSYVLTAAHCATIGEFKPSIVVLGDYNKTYNGPDCVLYPNGEKLCSKGEVRIRIEKVIPHQFYTEGADSFSGLQWNHNDIALLKLQQMVSYTESVRPICLPTTDLTKASERFLNKLNLTAAGWGYKKKVPYGWSFNGIKSDIKRHVRLPYVPLETCKNVFGHATEYHICAGGEKGKDTCNGDSGGPLMFSKHGQFELTGITSYGENNPCGNGSPGVYTNVYRYKRWIMDVVKYGNTE